MNHISNFLQQLITQTFNHWVILNISILSYIAELLYQYLKKKK